MTNAAISDGGGNGRSETRPDIVHAAQLLRAGKLVAVPTETVYGLAADASNEAAIARVFAVKRRPADHPLIVHLADADWVDRWAESVPPTALALARRFWPGPLTLVLRRRPRVSPLVTGGQDTVAVRVPDHALTLALLRHFGGAVVAPSANPFCAVSPTRAADVHAMFGPGDGVDFVLDGGDCRVGVESTILDLSGDRPTLLRPGGIDREALADALGDDPDDGARSRVRVPGQHSRHYSPQATVLLCDRPSLASRIAHELQRGLTVGALVPPDIAVHAHQRLIAIPVPLSLAAYARQLYRCLRAFDEARCDVICATLPEENGLGHAIADRLCRAAGGSRPAIVASRS